MKICSLYKLFQAYYKKQSDENTNIKKTYRNSEKFNNYGKIENARFDDNKRSKCLGI